MRRGEEVGGGMRRGEEEGWDEKRKGGENLCSDGLQINRTDMK